MINIVLSDQIANTDEHIKNHAYIRSLDFKTLNNHCLGLANDMTHSVDVMKTSLMVDEERRTFVVNRAFKKQDTMPNDPKKYRDIFSVDKDCESNKQKNVTSERKILKRTKNDGKKDLTKLKADKDTKCNKHIKVSHEIFFALRRRNIFDDYEIIKQLGEGAYGVVKLGMNKKLNIYRALKFIPKNSNNSIEGK